MRSLLALSFVLAVSPASPARAAVNTATPEPTAPPRPESSCITCHAQLEDKALEPTKHTRDDIHFLKGLSCHSCHGGNPLVGADGDIEAAHDEKKGWKKPSRAEIPVFCGTCHSNAAFMKQYNPATRVDQLSEYRTSVHGKRNAQGDVKAAVCVDCHGVHGIRAVKDARSSVYPTHLADTCARCHADAEKMKPYGIPTNQFADYRSSVHAKALYEKGDTAAPTCKSCHGSHGAVPPGVETTANVCGTCHAREATMFREVENRKHIELIKCIQCVVCHGNHAVKAPDDDMFGVGPRSTCTGCHPQGFPLYDKVAEMSAALTALKGRVETARKLLDRAERAGVEVGADRVAFQKAQDRLVELRVLAHAFDREKYLLTAKEGTAAAEAGVVAGNNALKELRYRRTGLGVSLVVILGVIGGLVLKLREIERPR